MHISMLWVLRQDKTRHIGSFQVPVAFDMDYNVKSYYGGVQDSVFAINGGRKSSRKQRLPLRFSLSNPTSMATDISRRLLDNLSNKQHNTKHQPHMKDRQNMDAKLSQHNIQADQFSPKSCYERKDLQHFRGKPAARYWYCRVFSSCRSQGPQGLRLFSSDASPQRSARRRSSGVILMPSLRISLEASACLSICSSSAAERSAMKRRRRRSTSAGLGRRGGAGVPLAVLGAGEPLWLRCEGALEASRMLRARLELPWGDCHGYSGCGRFRILPSF
ncbi:hypothetical protein GE09DRAFT_393079 [Coniochaeta sp. 2T2.1]|nr:hypothetical protein GE09DRAFT_393079 [Coniochaeta sp. 2T2.1]